MKTEKYRGGREIGVEADRAGGQQDSRRNGRAEEMEVEKMSML